MAKTFKFDVILDEEDLCDRTQEIKRLTSVIGRRGRIVIYSLRRMGKTSLVSVCGKRMKRSDPKAFHLYVDLNEVASLHDVVGRFRSHYEFALNEQLPVKTVKSFLNSLLSRVNVTLPGDIELSLDRYAHRHPEEYLLSLFGELSRMSGKYNLLLILDEFQGIAGLPDAQAMLRREIQKLSRVPVILMGSNQRLLYKMFNDKNKPFFSFGEDMELVPIAVNDYLPYMNERFAPSDIEIGRESAEYLLEKTNHIPNYVNELGAWIAETRSRAVLTPGLVDESLEVCALSKRGRYDSALFGYTANQRTFLRAVADFGRVKSPTGRDMLERTGLSPTELSRALASLEGSPLITHDTENRIFILDPFFRKYLCL